MPEIDSEYVFLRALFSALDSAGIIYAVMRNHERLPYSAGGSDLDILVDPDHGSRARKVVMEAIRCVDGVPIGVAESAGFFKVYALGKSEGATLPWWGLCVDVNIGLHYRGQRLLSKGVDWPLIYHNGIPVLSAGFSGVLGVLKEVLHNEMVPLRYAPAAREAEQSNWPQIEDLLAPMGRAALSRFRAIILSKAEPDRLQGECRRLRQDVICHAIARRGLVSLWMHISYKLTKVHRYLKPPGVVIAMLGVDGSGKTTVINAILPALNAATHNAVHVRHLRPTLLPPLARLKGKKSMITGAVLEPHGSTPSGKMGSLLRLSYLTLDYAFGYWLWTRPKVAKQPAVVIFDRYAYDMALDPRRFRIAHSSRVVDWFASLAPKPDLIFCLHGNPDLLASRKHELPLEETRRQVKALRTFAGREPRAVLISTETEIEETRDKVLQTLCDFLQTRIAKKL